MLLKYNEKEVLLSQIVFSKDYIFLNNKIKISKDNEFDIISNENKFSINKLINILSKNKENFDIIFIINEETESMYIKYDQNLTTGDLLNIEVYINSFLLSEFNEEEIAIYIYHEIGHLLDINNERIFEKRKKILEVFFYIVYMIGIFLYLKKDINSYFLIAIMFVSPFCFFLISKYLDRVLEYNADSYAVKMIKDYKKVIKAYKKIDLYYGEEKTSFFRSITSTHPSFKDRISHLRYKYWYLIVWDFLFSSKK